MIKLIPKLRYKIVTILGDFYYQEMPIDQMIDIVFKEIPGHIKNDSDLERFIEQNLNVPFSLDRPQY
jgi:hypothetical protein